MDLLNWLNFDLSMAGLSDCTEVQITTRGRFYKCAYITYKKKEKASIFKSEICIKHIHIYNISKSANPKTKVFLLTTHVTPIYV